MSIPMPDENEKNMSIEFILSKGLSRPKSLGSHLRELYQSLGFGCIFCDTADSIFLSTIVSIGLAFLLIFLPVRFVYGMLFALAPVLYLLLTLVTEVKERMSCLYELKMTCKFTIRQITAFRMLCFSGIGIVFCVLMSAGIYLFAGFQDFGRMLVISLCALFLCSLFSLWTMLQIRQQRWMCYTLSAAWIALFLLPISLFGEQWELILSKIPIGAALCIITVSGWLYLREIKKLMRNNAREVVLYAND